jgi:acyl-CoA synthetase (AMP-forming)/AMP-acid ligase II
MISTYLARSQWILFDKTSVNFLSILSKEKVNILSVVPAILYEIFKENMSWVPNTELRYILSAAAPLSASLLAQVMAAWNIKVVQGYGLSESTNFSCTMPANIDNELYKKIMFPLPSVGISLDGVEIKVGEENSEGTTGELFIKSSSNCLGYYGSTEFIELEWVATGDLGYYKTFQGRRFYYLTGRIKEIINRGGEKISPVELESELHNIGFNSECAVISIWSEQYGEDVGLVCTDLVNLSLLKKIPFYRRPKKVFLLENLFYTPTGKLERKRLAEYCNAGNAKILMDSITKNI